MIKIDLMDSGLYELTENQTLLEKSCYEIAADIRLMSDKMLENCAIMRGRLLKTNLIDLDEVLKRLAEIESQAAHLPLVLNSKRVKFLESKNRSVVSCFQFCKQNAYITTFVGDKELLKKHSITHVSLSSGVHVIYDFQLILQEFADFFYPKI